MTKYETFINAVGRVFFYAAIFLLGLLVLMTLFDVIGRRYLGTPFPGAIQIGEGIMVFICYLALSETQAQKRHIKVNVLVDRLHGKAHTWVERINLFVFIAILCLIGVAGFEAAYRSTLLQEFQWGDIKFPVWIVRWIVPLGIVALCLRLVAPIVASARHFLRHKSR